MRSERAFLSEYCEALGRVDPSCLDGLAADRVRTLGQTEMCLAFLERFLPEESYRTVPFLMMGYGKLLDGRAREPERVGRALAAIRHLCSRFGSVSAWIDATAQYARTPGTVRCFDLDAKGVTARATAPALLRAVLDRWLTSTVGWTERELRLADPGEAFVTVSPRTKLSYQVPAVPPARRAANRYALRPRATNPRIRVTFDELRAVARQVDARESEAGWPVDSLPPLDLTRRLDKLEPRDVSGFLDGDAIVLDGATHVVGMLSSGKSTLVMALLLGLTLGGSGKRIAVLVTDTMQGATLAARLRRHGVRASVLSSLRNREGHLHAIHWQRSLGATGWSLSGLGDLSEGFGTACPLDGAQGDPEVVEGERGADWTFPRFAEKQCHRLYQKALPDEDDGSGHPADPDDVGGMPPARSCPLWATCPAQEQQRSAVDAQVLFMTPQAFVHITPDKWTTERHVSMPELVQYEFDLVIVDEVDGVQKGLDDAFAPRSPIMGDDRDVYAPNIGLRSSEALRERSGAQFRKPLNAKWQSNFYTFFRLIGMIDAVLQNERSDLRTFYEDTPFTAGSILYDLWRRRNLASGLRREDQTFSNPVFAVEFLEVVKVASAIRGFSPVSSVSTDEPEGEGEGASGPVFADARFEAAASALRELAREIVVADTYEGLTERVTAALGRDGPLAVFNGARLEGRKSELLSLRGAALAVILATVTDLALSHYNWLIKTQSAVARDFKIEDGYLLGRTDSLIRNYKTLLPANPAGAAFGLFYDEPGDRERQAMGGKLTLLSHLGVGRHLLTHLHDLLAAEGQAGPHVLMLSGTSWAGGGERRPNPATGKPMDAASPSFDVQVPPHGYDRKSSPSRSLDVFMPSPEAEPGYAGYRHTAFGFRALVTNMDDVIRRNATREVPGSWTSHQDKHVFDVVRRLAGGRGLEGASLADPAVDRDGLWVLPRLAPGNHDRYLAGGSGIGRPDRRDIAQSLDEPLRAAGLERAPTMRRVRLTLPVGGPFEKAADEDLDVQRRRRREALNATLGVLGNGDGLDLLVLHIRDETPALVRKEVEELLGPPDAADGGLLSWADGLVLRLMPAPAGPLAQLLRKARLDDAETEGRTSQQIAEIRRLRQDQANEEGAAEMREHVAHVRGGRKAVACAILEMPANFKGDEHDPYVLARRELAAGRVLPQVVLHDEANPNDQKYRASVADWIRMLGVVPVSAGDEEGARRSRNRPDLAPAAMTVVQRNSQAAGGGARIATQAFPLAARVNGSVLECAAPGPDGNPEWKAYGLVALDILSGGNQRWARNQRDENVRLFENFFAEAVRDIDRRGDTLLVLDGDTMPKWIKDLQNGRLTFDDVGVGRLRADPAGLPRTRMVRVTTADQRLPMYYYLEETKWAQGLFRWGDAGRTAYGLKRKPPTMKTVGRTANVSRNAASGDNLAGDHDPRRLAAMDELTLVLAQPGDDPDAVLMFAHRLRTVHAQYAEDTKQPFPLHELRLLGKAVTA